jgi:hypothetical protein
LHHQLNAQRHDSRLSLVETQVNENVTAAGSDSGIREAWVLLAAGLATTRLHGFLPGMSL